MALTDVVYKILTFIVLAPIVATAFRLFVEFSGRTVLADEDILLFFISPVGWLCFITVGGLSLAIVALGQAALLHLLHKNTPDRRRRVIEGLGFALSHSRSVLKLTARIAAITLLAVIPCLAVAGAVYFALLNQYDINYYLSEKPPVFWWAVICGVLIISTLTIVLLRLFSGWLFALPLVLFERLDVVESMRVSRALANGRRTRLIVWLATWALATTLLSALSTGIVALLGQLTVPHATSSVPLLLFAVGAVVIV
jgi:glycerophosphoryl diester phosphodiesterase